MIWGRRCSNECTSPLEQLRLKPSAGTIVDASIILAPSSTKNAAQARDREMLQTKKGNQWYFGIKANIGVDSRSKQGWVERRVPIAFDSCWLVLMGCAALHPSYPPGTAAKMDCHARCAGRAI